MEMRKPKKPHLYDKTYGPNRVWITDDDWVSGLLAKLSCQETVNPEVCRLVESLYMNLIQTVVNVVFPHEQRQVRTRMFPTMGERGVLTYQAPNPSTPVTIATMIRAGVRPSNVCFDQLNLVLDPAQVTQDWIAIQRTTDNNHHVTGAATDYFKNAQHPTGRILILPDCMGATGSSILETIELYRKHYYGEEFRAMIAMHLIITPEYLRAVMAKEPNLMVFAHRMDRGMSTPEIQDTIPGTHPDQEFGLNDNGYIVPGAGGLGEILNNAFC